jgi:hypothetical protein
VELLEVQVDRARLAVLRAERPAVLRAERPAVLRAERPAVEQAAVAITALVVEVEEEVALAAVVPGAAVELALQAARISRRTMAPVRLRRWNSMPVRENTSRQMARRIWI